MKQKKYKFLLDCTVGFSAPVFLRHTTHLPVQHFLWLLMPVRLQTTGHEHFTEPTAPQGWSQSFPFWPAVCACPARTRRFLFGFLQERVTFAMEDFVWRVASARAVIHSFLFLLHTGWRAESPSEDSHEVEEGLSDRKSNMLVEIYSIIFSKSIPPLHEAIPHWSHFAPSQENCKLIFHILKRNHLYWTSNCCRQVCATRLSLVLLSLLLYACSVQL